MKLFVTAIVAGLFAISSPAHTQTIKEFEQSWDDFSRAELEVSDCLIQCVAARDACMGNRPGPLGNIAGLDRSLRAQSSCLAEYFSCNRQCNGAAAEAFGRLK